MEMKTMPDRSKCKKGDKKPVSASFYKTLSTAHAEYKKKKGTGGHKGGFKGKKSVNTATKTEDSDEEESEGESEEEQAPAPAPTRKKRLVKVMIKNDHATQEATGHQARSTWGQAITDSDERTASVARTAASVASMNKYASELQRARGLPVAVQGLPICTEYTGPTFGTGEHGDGYATHIGGWTNEMRPQMTAIKKNGTVMVITRSGKSTQPTLAEEQSELERRTPRDTKPTTQWSAEIWKLKQTNLIKKNDDWATDAVWDEMIAMLVEYNNKGNIQSEEAPGQDFWMKIKWIGNAISKVSDACDIPAPEAKGGKEEVLQALGEYLEQAAKTLQPPTPEPMGQEYFDDIETDIEDLVKVATEGAKIKTKTHRVTRAQTERMRTGDFEGLDLFGENLATPEAEPSLERGPEIARGEGESASTAERAAMLGSSHNAAARHAPTLCAPGPSDDEKSAPKGAEDAVKGEAENEAPRCARPGCRNRVRWDSSSGTFFTYCSPNCQTAPPCLEEIEVECEMVEE